MLRFMLVCYQMLQIKKETILCYFAAILHPCIGRQAIGPLYQYFFTIYTGSRPNSGTTAHVLDRDNITWDKKQVRYIFCGFVSVFLNFREKCGSRTTFSAFMLVKGHFNKDTTCCVPIQKIGSQWIKSLLPINLFKGPPSDRRCVRNSSFTISCVSPLTHGQYTKRRSHFQSSVGIVQLAEKVGVQLAYIQTFYRTFYGEQISKEAAISFSRTSNILHLIRFIYIYISHSPFNVGNASLFVCLHGCAVACASRNICSV